MLVVQKVRRTRSYITSKLRLKLSRVRENTPIALSIPDFVSF